MNSFRHIPLDQVVSSAWNTLDAAYRTAFFFVVAISVLAFGFEMTNLIFHHDDVNQIFIQDTILGHYLGRFGVGWLHYYTQNAYFMPFLQMAQGIVFMAGYGLIIARFWGLRKTFDIVAVGAIVCVFPFMAQVYQYNTSMSTYSLAHLLVALAVMLSVQARFVYVALAALLYVAAFSIYQSVISNAATIFLLWVTAGLVFSAERDSGLFKGILKSAVAALVAVGVGGLVYVAAVSSMHLTFDAYQSAGQAFSVERKFDLLHGFNEIWNGTRRFFLWPEAYFPVYLKNTQLVLLGLAFAICVWAPKGMPRKIGAVAALVAALLSPRLLQFLHPEGNYHSLTLTAYAVVVAGAVMIIMRAGSILIRNATILLTVFLLAGYLLQCNWISTVNYLNNLAHFNTLTQMLARIRSVPDAQWDGKKVIVVGRYHMQQAYPFKGATGVATQFLDPKHMQQLALLMRDEIVFVPADSTTPKALEYAASHDPWPNPASFAVVDGTGVLVLSKDQPATQSQVEP
jgi:hypothetical protein